MNHDDEYHVDYKYSATIHTDDEALAVTLRALAWYCQASGNRQIAVAIHFPMFLMRSSLA